MDLRGMTLKGWAQQLAEKANECCYRSDGYEAALENDILDGLLAAYRKGRSDSLHERHG